MKNQKRNRPGTAITLSREMHNWLRDAADHQGRSKSAVVDSALRFYRTRSGDTPLDKIQQAQCALDQALELLGE